jgi:hypothetical protein
MQKERGNHTSASGIAASPPTPRKGSKRNVTTDFKIILTHRFVLNLEILNSKMLLLHPLGTGDIYLQILATTI